MSDRENSDLMATETTSGDPLGTPATRIAPISPKLAELAERAEELRLALPTERQRRYVLEYMLPTDGRLNATQAALRAGFPVSTARSYARRLSKDPRIKAAIVAKHAELAAANAYTQEKCVAELDDAMDFAKRTSNASAFVRAIELKGKLHGYIVDRVDARIAVGTFQINVHGLGGGNG